MADMADDSGLIVDHVVNQEPETSGETTLTRRELLKQAGFVGAMAVLPVSVLAPATTAAPAPGPAQTLTAPEFSTLEAIVRRLIPTDENGPGATEAGASTYIDRALAGPLASSRGAYSAGLAAVDRYAQTAKGAPFAKLSAEAQDAVLTDMEKNVATGFNNDSAAFFGLLRAHTIQGTFCDPYYGGNVNFAGWDLIGYPGVRISVASEEQSMEAALKPNHKSAYDYGMFSKKGL